MPKFTDSLQLHSAIPDMNTKKAKIYAIFAFRAPPGARTLDPNIKSVVLYQLS